VDPAQSDQAWCRFRGRLLAWRTLVEGVLVCDHWSVRGLNNASPPAGKNWYSAKQSGAWTSGCNNMVASKVRDWSACANGLDDFGTPGTRLSTSVSRATPGPPPNENKQQRQPGFLLIRATSSIPVAGQVAPRVLTTPHRIMPILQRERQRKRSREEGYASTRRQCLETEDARHRQPVREAMSTILWTGQCHRHAAWRLEQQQQRAGRHCLLRNVLKQLLAILDDHVAPGT
jgi:hypothetical protein